MALGAMLSRVYRLLMRDGTIQAGKTYILKWIKVIAVLRPAREAQINLSCAGDDKGEMVGHPE